jgi:ubiquinol-cytochrome c reductase cytochrome c1 subunit
VELHAHTLPWSHYGWNQTLDYTSVRRGYQVYKQVCSACHSLDFICYRHFVNVFLTLDEAKAEAAEAMIPDTDDQGKAMLRPGTINDKLPHPYINKKAAMAANDGVEPPDLSVMTLARHGAESYVFHLLVGYVDAPAGIVVPAGKAYNPYFQGSIISMPQQLYDDGCEFDDGTAPTQSQQAKDVSTFLAWCSEPYHDLRKNLGLKCLLITPPLFIVLLYMKKFVWSYIHTQKFAWVALKGRQGPASYKPK